MVEQVEKDVLAFMSAIARVPVERLAQPVLSSTTLLRFYDQSIVHRGVMWVFSLLPALSRREALVPVVRAHLVDVLCAEVGVVPDSSLQRVHECLLALVCSARVTGPSKRRLIVSIPYLVQVALSNGSGSTAYFANYQLPALKQYITFGMGRGSHSDALVGSIRYYHASITRDYPAWMTRTRLRYLGRVGGVRRLLWWWTWCSSEPALWTSIITLAVANISKRGRVNTNVDPVPPRFQPGQVGVD